MVKGGLTIPLFVLLVLALSRIIKPSSNHYTPPLYAHDKPYLASLKFSHNRVDLNVWSVNGQHHTTPVSSSLRVHSFVFICKSTRLLVASPHMIILTIFQVDFTIYNVIFTTCKKISSKSLPFFFFSQLNPFIANLALYIGCEFFSSVFNFKIDLFFRALLPLGSFTRS